MSKLLVIGSINLDLVFSVDQFVSAGETIHSHKMETFMGGKGLNQAIALSRATPNVFLAANIGQSDAAHKSTIRNLGVDPTYIQTVTEPTGMAFIQVNAQGQNCIVHNSGANAAFTTERFEEVLSHFEPGDTLVLQNEINGSAELIGLAKAKGLKVAFNPSPFTPAILDLPLSLIDTLIVNEVEGEGLSGSSDPEIILSTLSTRHPSTQIILTLGEHGVMAMVNGKRLVVEALKVKAVDTTAAGDTFLGFYLGSLAEGSGIEEALRTAVIASGITVTRPGASSSIPTLSEVCAYRNSHSQ
jgi:ribokinase